MPYGARLKGVKRESAGRPLEYDSRMIQLCTTIPDKLMRHLDQKAFDLRISKSKLIRLALADYMDVDLDKLSAPGNETPKPKQ